MLRRKRPQERLLLLVMTRTNWLRIYALCPPELQARIKAVGKSTDADEFDVWVGISEAVAVGDDELIRYAVYLVEVEWS